MRTRALQKEESVSHNDQEKLFKIYQAKLAWSRRMQQTKDATWQKRLMTDDAWDFAWCQTRYAIFSMYEDLRDPPNFAECIEHGPEFNIPDNILRVGESEFCRVGTLSYRGIKFPIYYDEGGSEEFVHLEDEGGSEDISMGMDWWYEIDRFIDRINS